MTSENSKKAERKQRITYQLEELAGIFLYLAFFFCAVATYRLLLLNEFHVSYFDYGTALINALIIAKVVLIGEDVHLGRKHETKPLLVSALHKAFLFGLLVFGFHVAEEVIKRLMHGEHMAGAFHDLRIDDVLARCVVTMRNTTSLLFAPSPATCSYSSATEFWMLATRPGTCLDGTEWNRDECWRERPDSPAEPREPCA